MRQLPHANLSFPLSLSPSPSLFLSISLSISQRSSVGGRCRARTLWFRACRESYQSVDRQARAVAHSITVREGESVGITLTLTLYHFDSDSHSLTLSRAGGATARALLGVGRGAQQGAHVRKGVVEGQQRRVRRSEPVPRQPRKVLIHPASRCRSAMALHFSGQQRP